MNKKQAFVVYVYILAFVTTILFLTGCQPAARPQPEPDKEDYMSIANLKSELLDLGVGSQKTADVEGYVVFRFDNGDVILADEKTAIIFRNAGLSQKYLGKKIKIKLVKAVYEDKSFKLEKTDKTEVYIDTSGKNPPTAKDISSLGELATENQKEKFVVANGYYGMVRGTVKFDENRRYLFKYIVASKNQFLEIDDAASINLLNSFNSNQPIKVEVEATLTGYLFYKENSWKFRIASADLKLPNPNVDVGVEIRGHLPPVTQATVTYFSTTSTLKIECSYPESDVSFMFYKELRNPDSQEERIYELIGESTQTVFEKTNFSINDVTGIGLRVRSADKTKESELFVIPKDEFILR